MALGVAHEEDVVREWPEVFSQDSERGHFVDGYHCVRTQKVMKLASCAKLWQSLHVLEPKL